MPLKDLLFSFKGRINRQPFWLATIGLGVALWVISTVIAIILITLLFDEPTAEVGSSVGYVVSALVSLVFLWPFIALAVKRSHDRGKSGWFLLLYLVPFVSLWPIIELYFLRGTDGPNRFGPDPLAPDSPAVDMPASPPEVEPGPPAPG